MTGVRPVSRPALRSAVRSAPRAAPLTRLLRSELRCALNRPRTLVTFAVLAFVPLVIAFGVAASGTPSGARSGPGPGLIAAVTANGLMLPVAALAVALTLLLPLSASVAAADALAGEAADGTLRGLLLAPVGRARLVGIKAAGVLAVVLVGVLLVTAFGAVAGTVVVGGHGRLLTLSGSAVDPANALARVGLACGWTALQTAAVGAVALAVSAFTVRPLVVIATVLGGAIVAGVLTAIPSLGWLHPWLLISDWGALADLLRDPVPTDSLWHGVLLAVGYLVAGLALALLGTLRREA